MPINFELITVGEKHAASRIEGMGTAASNIRPALEEIYLTVLDIIEEAFEKEGARAGFPKWARLQLSTVVDKAKRGFDPRILRATGELYAGMTTYRGDEQYARIERDRIILTPRSVKGKVAQVGTRDGKIPARPMIRFAEGDRQAFAREILHHITRRRAVR